MVKLAHMIVLPAGPWRERRRRVQMMPLSPPVMHDAARWATRETKGPVRGSRGRVVARAWCERGAVRSVREDHEA